MSTSEKPEEFSTEYVTNEHADGTVDLVDARVLGGDLDDMPDGYFMTFSFMGTFIATCFGSICAYLGWVLPANTLELINQDIGPSADIAWVGTAWTVGSSIGFLLFGRISDIFGRRWIVIINMCLGLIGCIVGAVAQDVNTLIGANVCNGLSSAGQLSFGVTIGELVSNKHRGPVLAVCFMSSFPFAVFGPVIARSFITNTGQGWRWSFYIGIILSVFTIILYYFTYYPPTYAQLHVQGKTKRQQVKELDYGGVFLFIAGMVLFLVGLSWGGTSRPWKDAGVICTIIIGFLTLIGFGFYEHYIVKTGALMPPRLFKSVGFTAIVSVAALGAMNYYGLTVLWPKALTSIYTSDPVKVGWQSSTIGGGILLGQLIAGVAISYIPKVKVQTTLASCAVCAFLGALASVSPDKHTAFIVLGLFGTIFNGFIENISYPAVTLVCEPQDIGLGFGVLGSVRAMGGAIAQAMYQSVLNTQLNDRIAEVVVPASTGAGLPESSVQSLIQSVAAGDFSQVPGMNQDILAVVTDALRTANVRSFKIVFYVMIPFSALLIISSALVPNLEPYLGNNVAKRLQVGNDKSKHASPSPYTEKGSDAAV